MTTRQFQRVILGWYRSRGRHDLPWRKTRNPYHILVSEVMLQQTYVGRVRQKYKKFLRTFPTAKTLARASRRDVLAAWQGLGYNRRALYLWRAVCTIKRRYGGNIPRDTKSLENLPGVGPYTARAVSVFAYGTPEVFVETNIRRVFLHFYFKNKKRISDKHILPFVHKTLWRKDPRVWYWALMDYGAKALKEIPNPNRASAHYTRQSRFLGSRRAVRAKIVSALLKKRRATLPELRVALRADIGLHNLASVMRDLAREGFIKKLGNRWTVA